MNVSWLIRDKGALFMKMKRWRLVLQMVFVSVWLHGNNPFITLPPSSRFVFNGRIELYVLPDCPYGLSVRTALRELGNIRPDLEVFIYDITPYFPSPTLRVEFDQGFLNFIGEKNAKSAIETIKKNLPFS
jgi:hypothetical protein